MTIRGPKILCKSVQFAFKRQIHSSTKEIAVTYISIVTKPTHEKNEVAQTSINNRERKRKPERRRKKTNAHCFLISKPPSFNTFASSRPHLAGLPIFSTKQGDERRHKQSKPWQLARTVTKTKRCFNARNATSSSATTAAPGCTSQLA